MNLMNSHTSHLSKETKQAYRDLFDYESARSWQRVAGGGRYRYKDSSIQVPEPGYSYDTTMKLTKQLSEWLVADGMHADNAIKFANNVVVEAYHYGQYRHKDGSVLFRDPELQWFGVDKNGHLQLWEFSPDSPRETVVPEHVLSGGFTELEAKAKPLLANHKNTQMAANILPVMIKRIMAPGITPENLEEALQSQPSHVTKTQIQKPVVSHPAPDKPAPIRHARKEHNARTDHNKKTHSYAQEYIDGVKNFFSDPANKPQVHGDGTDEYKGMVIPLNLIETENKRAVESLKYSLEGMGFKERVDFSWTPKTVLTSPANKEFFISKKIVQALAHDLQIDMGTSAFTSKNSGPGDENAVDQRWRKKFDRGEQPTQTFTSRSIRSPKNIIEI